MAARIFTFSSCTHIYFSFWRKRSFAFRSEKFRGEVVSKSKAVSKELISNLRLEKEGVSTYSVGCILLPPWSEPPQAHTLLCTASLCKYRGSPHPHHCCPYLPCMVLGQGFGRPSSFQLPWVGWQLPDRQLFELPIQFLQSLSLNTGRPGVRLRCKWG